MKNKTLESVKLFPYPGQHAQIARSRVNDHIIRDRLPKAEKSIRVLGLALMGVYALMAAALGVVGLKQWQANRVENHSLPLLVDGCYVKYNASACNEINRREKTERP